MLFQDLNEELNGQIFEGLVSLTKLVLYSSSSPFSGLRVLRRETLLFLPDLEWFELNDTGIVSIESGAFNHLTKLVRLKIRLSYGVCPRLIELTNLEILCLRSNGISSVDELFAGMTNDAVNTKLRVIDLTYNPLWLIMPEFKQFSRLVSLARLDYDKRQIRLY
jgi:hypothetical protein